MTCRVNDCDSQGPCTVTCRDCETAYSSDERECPHCGLRTCMQDPCPKPPHKSEAPGTVLSDGRIVVCDGVDGFKFPPIRYGKVWIEAEQIKAAESHGWKVEPWEGGRNDGGTAPLFTAERYHRRDENWG